MFPLSAYAEVRSREASDTTPDLGLPREGTHLVSAFFGLDSSLPMTAHRICLGTAGLDGMPVIFSAEIDHETVQAGDFRVTTDSGVIGKVECVSFLPATDAGELRTVLLMGEFGSAETDPPKRVEIVGHLHSIDGTRDFIGSSVNVTPLHAGPTIVLAERFDPDAEDLGLGLRRTRGTDCPPQGSVQAIRVVWSGGVKLANGDEPGDAQRQLYRVTVRTEDGGLREVTPTALADIGDGDNNHLLCLGTREHPVSVAFPAGIFTDPNDDLNPATAAQITVGLDPSDAP
jgi:hypothetical protein